VIFFQNGEYSAFATAFRATNKYAASGTADAPSVAYFLKKNSDGKWIDGTAELLPNKDDRLNCVSNGYSIVADFNNDGKPDVYLACNGIDADLLPEIKSKLTLNDQNNLGLSKQFIYLSTASGQYRRVMLPDMIYGHMAAAADLNHDGNIDILTTNQADVDIQPFIYLGNGDGTSNIDNSIIPPMMHQYTNKTPNDFHNAGLYQVELIPIDGRIDAIWASTAKTIWMKGRANGELGFNTEDVVIFETAKSPNYQLNYDMPKDFIYDYTKNVFYFGSRVAVDIYESKVEYAILKFSKSGEFLGAKGIWLNYNNHDPDTSIDFRFQSFTDQYKQLPNGSFKAYTSGCLIGVNGLPPQLPGRCTQTINVD
jgi:hypothetical protein